jgi:hypothetical protein
MFLTITTFAQATWEGGWDTFFQIQATAYLPPGLVRFSIVPLSFFFQDFSSLRYPYFGEISPLLFSLVHWESIVFFQDFSNPVAT